MSIPMHAFYVPGDNERLVATGNAPKFVNIRDKKGNIVVKDYTTYGAGYKKSDAVKSLEAGGFRGYGGIKPSQMLYQGQVYSFYE